MNKIEINIGLGNNPFTAQQIVSSFVTYYTSVKHAIKQGEWEGASNYDVPTPSHPEIIEWLEKNPQFPSEYDEYGNPTDETYQDAIDEMKHLQSIAEDTVVMEFFSDEPVDTLRDMLKALTLTMTQDAIAFRFNGAGELVFNPDYTGELYKFDENYFLTI